MWLVWIFSVSIRFAREINSFVTPNKEKSKAWNRFELSVGQQRGTRRRCWQRVGHLGRVCAEQLLRSQMAGQNRHVGTVSFWTHSSTSWTFPEQFDQTDSETAMDVRWCVKEWFVRIYWVSHYPERSDSQQRSTQVGEFSHGDWICSDRDLVDHFWKDLSLFIAPDFAV
jgi:hypothetical protein